MDDAIIKVEHVSKVFKLPHEKQSSIKSLILNFYKRDKGFERQRALNDVSFTVNKGDFFGIVGRNGSGKSTLLKILAGIYTTTEGAVEVSGKLIPFIELGVGFSPELTGRENVFLNGALLGFSRKEMAAMYDDIVEFAEIERFMDQKLKNYSSGMHVRLAFSIAIRAKGDILLLDEVLAVGDVAFQKKCFDYFKQLKKDKQTVVFVSHDMDAIEKYCNRAILIRDGKLIDDGKPKEIGAKYRILNLPKKNQQTGVPRLFGDVEVNKVLINDEKQITVTGDKELCVEVDYTPKKTKKIIVAVSIFRADGEHVAYYDSRLKSKKIDRLAGETYKAQCRFNAKQFLEGAYQVSIDLYDENYIYLANEDKVVSFAVIGANLDKAGYFRIQGEWEVEKE